MHCNILSATVFLFFSIQTHYGDCITILGFNLPSPFDPPIKPVPHKDKNVSFYWGPNINQKVLSNLERLFKSQKYLIASSEEREKIMRRFMARVNGIGKAPVIVEKNPNTISPTKKTPRVKNSDDVEPQVPPYIREKDNKSSSTSCQTLLNNTNPNVVDIVSKMTAEPSPTDKNKKYSSQNKKDLKSSNTINIAVESIASLEKNRDQLLSTDNNLGLTTTIENSTPSKQSTIKTSESADDIVLTSSTDISNLTSPAEISNLTRPAVAIPNFITVPENDDIENFIRKKRWTHKKVAMKENKTNLLDGGKHIKEFESIREVLP